MKFLFTLFFIAYSISSFSQDLIFLKSNEVIQSKVLEIDSVYIKYLEYENQSGATQFVAKQKVIMIMYENGKKEAFDESELDQNESILPDGTFKMDFLGLLQYGPIFQYEIKISDQVYLVPSVRFGYLGLLYHAIWGVWDEKGDYLTFPCAGIGLGGKRYHLTLYDNAIYYGGFIEYGSSTTVWDEGTINESYQKWKGLQIFGNGGFRWRYGSGMFLNAGIYAGPSIVLSDKRYFENDESLNTEYDDAGRFIVFFELSFGWEF